MTHQAFRLKYSYPTGSEGIIEFKHLGGEGYLALFTIGVKIHGVENFQLHDPDLLLLLSANLRTSARKKPLNCLQQKDRQV